MTREEKDNQLLAAAFEELDAHEAKTGQVVDVHIDISNAAGNCMSGVLEWRKKWAGGREVVSARELLQIAAQCRDQISRVVLGVRKAISRS